MAIEDGKNEAKVQRVRAVEKAGRDIRKELGKRGVPFDDAAIERALGMLYAKYEADGTVPTREGFAECAGDAAAGDAVKSMKRDPFVADGRGKAFAIAAAVVVVAAAAAACAWAFGGQSAQAPQESAPSAPPAASQAEELPGKVTLVLSAEGGEEGFASPAVAEIREKGGDALEGFAAIELDKPGAKALGELEPGEYELAVTQAPVLEDGATYELPEKPSSFEVKGDGGKVKVEIELEPLAADDMTKEQLEAAAEALESAGKPDAAKAVSEKSQGANSVPGSEAATSRPSGGAAEAPKPSGSGGSAQQPTQPEHVHSWVHHDAVYTTVHHDAVYDQVWHEPITETVVVCLDCGAINPGRDHMYQHAINGESGATTVENRIVQEGYYESILMSQAYDEQVLVSAAYDSCSCGAVK